MKLPSLASLVLAACAPAATPPAKPPVTTIVGAAPTIPVAPHDAAAASWPSAVDTSLGAPDGFHLLAVSKDGKNVLTTVTTTISFFDKHERRMSRSNGAYVAELDLERGCMNATYDFPTLSAASATGTHAEALAILNSPAMATDLARAKAIARAYGANSAPIRVSPDGRYVVLEANNAIYMAIDGGAFAHFGKPAAIMPTVSEAGRHVLFGNGSGIYAPSVLDLQTQRVRPVTRAKGASMTVKDLFPLADGSFLAAQEPVRSGRGGSKICLAKIDVEQARETEMVCVPSRVLSASVGEISTTGRYAMLHAEGPDRVVVWDTNTWQVVTDVPGKPIYAKLDSEGHVAWEELGGVVQIAKGGRVHTMQLEREPSGLYPTLAGYLGARLLLGHPAAKAFAFEGPLKSLKDAGPCGWLTVAEPPP